jgi:hypothetical protein
MSNVYPLIDYGVNSKQSVYATSTTKHHKLGTRGRIGNKVFYYASSTGAALVKGSIVRSEPGTGNHLSVATVVGVAGASTVSATLGATSAAANLYEDGYFLVLDGTGQGQERRIVSHAANTGSAILVMAIEEPLETTLASSDEVSLRKNLFKSVVVTDGDAVGGVVGIVPCEVGAGTSTEQYFWVQTWGPAMVLCDATAFTVGAPVTYSTAATDDDGQATTTIYSTAFTTASATTVSPTLAITLREIIGTSLDPGDTADAETKWINVKIFP